MKSERGRWKGIAWVVLVEIVAGPGSWGGDWPEFLGGGRDGKLEPGEVVPLLDDEPGAGFSVVWEKEVGAGFAGPVVSEEKVILFHRVDDEAVVQAFQAKNGELIWRTTYPCDYRDDFGFDPGPRSAPTVSGGSVFCYGAEGKVTALDLATGEIRWQVDAVEEFESPKGFFGRACAPLVVGDLVMVNVGGKLAGKGAGIVAFDTKTGEIRWVTSGDEASYSSPLFREIAGEEVGIFLTRGGICGVEVKGGVILFQEAFRPETHPTVSAASPVDCGGNRFFFSASYDLGAGVWKVGDDAKSLEQVWKREGVLDCHYATPVFAGGHLYGFHGRQERGQELRCVSAEDGKVQWSEKMAPGNVILSGDKLIALTEKGELIFVRAGGDKYEELGRGQLLRAGSRAYPALADGFLYARDEGRLVCVDLREQ